MALGVSLPPLPAGYNRDSFADRVACWLMVGGALVVIVTALVLAGLTAGDILAEAAP